MKHFNFKKIFMLLTLVIVVGNGSAMVPNVSGDNGAYAATEEVSPCSDAPDFDESYN